MGLSVTLECSEQAAAFTSKKALLNGLQDDEWIFQQESVCSHSSYYEHYHCSISGTPLEYNYPYLRALVLVFCSLKSAVYLLSHTLP